MKFWKLHGCGNDYIFLDCTAGLPPRPEELARRMSDRHFGVGGDGLILLVPSRGADIGMVMYNADGSEGAMCGNGIRCAGALAWTLGLVRTTQLTVETKSGIRALSLTLEGNTVTAVQVDMGAPSLCAAAVPVVGLGDPVVDLPLTINGHPLRVTCVSMGNPHTVVWTDNVQVCPVEVLGPLLEEAPMFPDRCNVEFVQVVDANTIQMRVWERGSGETLSCGTGACAAAYASFLAGKVCASVTVRQPGGTLEVTCLPAENRIDLSGAVTLVFSGEFPSPLS